MHMLMMNQHLSLYEQKNINNIGLKLLIEKRILFRLFQICLLPVLLLSSLSLLLLLFVHVHACIVCITVID